LGVCRERNRGAALPIIIIRTALQQLYFPLAAASSSSTQSSSIINTCGMVIMNFPIYHLPILSLSLSISSSLWFLGAASTLDEMARRAGRLYRNEIKENKKVQGTITLKRGQNICDIETVSNSEDRRGRAPRKLRYCSFFTAEGELMSVSYLSRAKYFRLQIIR
jgi:hypothetical protein